MDITIIGTGNMARGIATRVLAGGHSVTLRGTAPDKAQALAAELSGSVESGVVGDPLSGDVVVLAIPYGAIAEVLGTYGGQFDGKVLIDITNPVNETYDALVTPPDGSAAQELAARAPGARVVKAFNTTFSNTLREGEVSGQPLDVFLAGDDEDAKNTVSQLVEDGGLRPIDAGPLSRARELEAAGLLHMSIQGSLGTGFGSALKILT